MSGNFPTDCKPYDLSVEVDSGNMLLKWKRDCPRTISGYNIYISEKLLGPDYGYKQIPDEIRPHNSQPFPGDTNPDDGIEIYEADGLKDGVKYYVSARIILPNGVQSRPTNEQMVDCGPSGEIELSIRFKSEQDGFSFGKEEFIRADNEENDLVYSNVEGVDYLSSPIKLNGFLKDIKLKPLPFSGGFEAVKAKAKTLDSTPSDDRLAVITGDWVWLMSPDKKSTLVKVLGFSGEGDERRIRLYYRHSTIAGEFFY